MWNFYLVLISIFWADMERKDIIIIIDGMLPFYNWFRFDRVVLSFNGVSSTLQTQANTKLQKVLVEYDL